MSSNSLFHFTSKKEFLINILTHNFRPRFCLEDLTNFTFGGEPLELAIPMVCFCDIPLSKIKVHLNKYGDYGIGLTKKWGILNGISPILYSEKDSRTANLIRNIFQEVIVNTKRGYHVTVDRSQDLIFDILRYTKPYQGKMWRKDKYIDKIRFYDEREWRYVPDTITKNIESVLSKVDYLNKEKRESLNKIMFDTFSIDFTPEDIKYIILSSEKEIDDFILEIDRIKGLKFEPKIIRKLSTRIITKEQLLYDF